MTLAGCASYRPAPPAFHEALNQPYLLDAGDRVRITVFEQPSLSNNYSVDQSGYIAFPLIGSVPARGKTSKQLESI
ncbi:sugar ABC transporter substrate-binding protein, partial [Brucella suis bv. 4 str. 40]